MKVTRLQPYAPTAFSPQEILLVLTSVIGSDDCKTILRRKGLNQWIIPINQSGFQPAAFRLVAQ
jgi:hypothetical protein